MRDALVWRYSELLSLQDRLSNRLSFMLGRKEGPLSKCVQFRPRPTAP